MPGYEPSSDPRYLPGQSEDPGIRRGEIEQELGANVRYLDDVRRMQSVFKADGWPDLVGTLEAQIQESLQAMENPLFTPNAEQLARWQGSVYAYRWLIQLPGVIEARIAESRAEIERLGRDLDEAQVEGS